MLVNERIGEEPSREIVSAYIGGTRRFPETPVATPMVTQPVLSSVAKREGAWREHATSVFTGASLDRVVKAAHAAHVAFGLIQNEAQAVEDEARLRWLAPFTFELVRSVGTDQILGLLDGVEFGQIDPIADSDPRVERVEELLADPDKFKQVVCFTNVVTNAMRQYEGPIAQHAHAYREDLGRNFLNNRADRDAIFTGAMALREQLAADLRPVITETLHASHLTTGHPNLDAWVHNGLLYQPADSLLAKYPQPTA